MKKSSLFAGVFVLSTMLGSSAFASTTLNYTSGTSDPFDGEPHTAIWLNYNGTNHNVYAGGFSMTDGIDNFIMWCVDLAGTLANGAQYNETANPFADGVDLAAIGVKTKVEDLFKYNYSTSFSNNEAAAFQLAIWEIAFDTGLNVYNGLVQQRGSYSSTVFGIAQDFIDNIGGIIANNNLAFRYFDDVPNQSQDLITAYEKSGNTTVPLPAAGWLLGGGLLSLFGFGRMKKRSEAKTIA